MNIETRGVGWLLALIVLVLAILFAALVFFLPGMGAHLSLILLGLVGLLALARLIP